MHQERDRQFLMAILKLRINTKKFTRRAWMFIINIELKKVAAEANITRFDTEDQNSTWKRIKFKSVQVLESVINEKKMYAKRSSHS